MHQYRTSEAQEGERQGARREGGRALALAVSHSLREERKRGGGERREGMTGKRRGPFGC